MKKRLLSLALLLALTLCLSIGVFAEGQTLGYVTDAAGLLTQKEQAELQALAQAASEQAQCGIYIVTVDDFRNYYATDSVEVAAQSIFDGYQLGWGADRDGILLLLSMAERDYDLDAHGAFGNAAFTDYGKDLLADEFLDDFSYNDWEDGFEDYIETAYSFAMTARNGEPVDSYGGRTADEGVTPGKVLALILVPALVALIVCSTIKSKMKSAVQKTEAADYMQTQNIRLTKTLDQFTHVTTTRTHIDRSRSTGGGGGGTTINSAGHSHSSGKF